MIFTRALDLRLSASEYRRLQLWLLRRVVEPSSSERPRKCGEQDATRAVTDTIYREEEDAALEQALTTRTPGPISRVARRVSQVDIPASPAQLAEVADQSFQAAKTKASELWDKTRIEEAIAIVRESASSVVFIQLAVLLVEAAGLGWNSRDTFVDFDIPAAAAQRLPIQKVWLPDLRFLLTQNFWAPTTLWSLTSWVLPLLFSYFFNLTLRSNTRHKSSNKQYTVDPLTFNIARAILAYSAYSIPVIDAALAGNPGEVVPAQKLSWGPFAEATVRTVRNNVPGQYNGLQIGSVIGILYSLYDAALKK